MNEESTLLNQAKNSIYKMTPSIIAAKLGYNTILLHLLVMGADFDYQSSAGWTALMYVGGNDNMQAARLLVEHYGADATLRNNAGDTAAQIARRIYNRNNRAVSIEMVNYLRDAERAQG